MAKKPFTTAASIEMTTLADPSASGDAEEPKFSPDRRRFAVVLKTGNLKSGLNEYRLLIYDANRVRREIAAPRIPTAIAIARFDTSSNRPGITDLRWVDNRRLAFLAENPGKVPQVYTADALTGTLRQLTHHPTAILGFDFRSDSERFIYAAEAPLDWSARTAHGYTVETENLIDVENAGRRSLRTRLAFFIGTRGARIGRAIAMLPYEVPWRPYGFWLSPSGRWAVAINHVENAPRDWWNSYEPIVHDRYFQGANDPAVRSFAQLPRQFFLQYMLVDMRTGRWSPLIDAPIDVLSGAPLRAVWLPEETSVILDNAFLPLTMTSAEEQERRRRSAAVAAVNVATRTVTRIADLSPSARSGMRRVGDLSLNAHGVLTIRWSGSVPQSFARKDNGSWIQTEAEPAAIHPLSVRVSQSLNTPPELLATDALTGRSKTITDLNPRFRDLDLGFVQAISWKDVRGRTWNGGLLKPRGYIAGRRYPLVIQTHGFHPNRFLLDGAVDTSGYAARALASRGLAVVQMGDMGPFGDRDELLRHIDGYRGLTESLASKGLIDRDRVGLHGFSRTGYDVLQALVFSDLKFAAASVADASELSTEAYVEFYGLGYPGMLEFERMMGAEPWGNERARLWAERDASLHLDRLTTPLRIEAHEDVLGGWWDVFAGLRRHRSPVEMISLPEGAHQLFRPWERLTSQEGSVDWYDFWLNGHEDPDPAKAAQYARWRRLRACLARPQHSAPAPRTPTEGREIAREFKDINANRAIQVPVPRSPDSEAFTQGCD